MHSTRLEKQADLSGFQREGKNLKPSREKASPAKRVKKYTKAATLQKKRQT